MKSPAVAAVAVSAATLVAVVAVGATRPAAPTSVGRRQATVDYLPNHALTPGVTNPNVTQANIKTTICKGGWTSTIRPKSLARSERDSIAAYGNHYTPQQVEYDHLISLELGGAPSDPRNLFPEPEVAHGPDGKDAGSRVKDNLESFLNAQVCGRRKPFITLVQAQQEIAGNWYATYTRLGRPANPYHHPSRSAAPSASPS